MGCGSSVAADDRTRQPSEGPEKSGAPSSPMQARKMSRQQGGGTGGNGSPGTANNNAKDDRYKDGQLQSINSGSSQSIAQDGVLSQALLNDFKQKTAKESNSVARWVESIVEPSDTDNADLYDPRRRHMLSMESIASRQLQAMQQNQALQQHQHHHHQQAASTLREQTTGSLSLTRDDMTPLTDGNNNNKAQTSLQASLSLALADETPNAMTTPLIPVHQALATSEADVASPLLGDAGAQPVKADAEGAKRQPEEPTRQPAEEENVKEAKEVPVAAPS